MTDPHKHNPEVGDGVYHKPTVMFRLRTYFLAGILVTAPIAITIYVTLWFLQFVDKSVASLIPEQYNPNTYLPFSIPGLGLLVSIVFFIFMGVLAKNFLGRMMIRVSEYIVDRLPVVSSIYGATKQVFQTVMMDQSRAFKDVVMLEFPSKGMWSLGFVTGITKGEVQRLTEHEVVNVYVPTTPNPTSGFLLFVPKKDLIFISMSAEDAIKMIVSGGILTPPEKPPGQKTNGNGQKK